MREGSYTQIKHGMRVQGRDGSTLGEVDEVIVDPASDIFVGLSVKPRLFVHPVFVPGEHVERLHERVVLVNAVREELKPYRSPEERHDEAEHAYEEVESSRKTRSKDSASQW
jgi:uncharacterized protein YrrD